MPETCVPTVIEVTGSMVPVAVMLFWILVIVAFSVIKLTLSLFLSFESSQKKGASTTSAIMAYPLFPIFLIWKFMYSFIFVVS